MRRQTRLQSGLLALAEVRLVFSVGGHAGGEATFVHSISGLTVPIKLPIPTELAENYLALARDLEEWVVQRSGLFEQTLAEEVVEVFDNYIVDEKL